MVKTFYDMDFLEKQYVLNYFNAQKLDDDHFLVTTDHGSWAVLSKREFDLLRFERIEQDPDLFAVLKDKGILLTENNIECVINDYAERNHFLFKGPSLHIITPTMRCNQRCVYCHSAVHGIDSKGYDMDNETAKAIVDFIFKSRTKLLVIEFQGGDCLLNFPVVEYIIDYANEKSEKEGKRVLFSLVTNLTLMDEDIIKSLKKRKLMGIATSLDGPKEIHDKNRKYIGGKGSHEDVVYWIKRIMTEWKHDFNLNALCTVTRNSLPHGDKIVDEYVGLGFKNIFLRPINNIGFAKDIWNKIGYNAYEFLDFWKSTLDYIISINSKTYLNEFLSTIFIKKLLQKTDPMFVDIQSPCGAGIGQMLYTYNGDIHTCDEGKLFKELKLGNVKTSRYEDIFRNESLINMVDISSKQSYLCDNCAFSPYCGICPIYTNSSQGTIVSKLAQDDRCIIYKEIIKTLFNKLIFSESDRNIFFRWCKQDTVLVPKKL